jgi:predicted nucleic acid-binding protein
MAHFRNFRKPGSFFEQATIAAAEQVDELIIPEIADYELRRKLIHLLEYRASRDARISLQRLDAFAGLLTYLPLSTMAMHRAAALWAQARGQGHGTASEEELDGEVVLAAQALEAEAVVVTENTKHLSRFVRAFHWKDLL